jgi:hypothetical protein
LSPPIRYIIDVKEKPQMATVSELQDQLDEQEGTIDQALEILEEAYSPEATRADLVAAVSEAIDVLSGEEEDEGEEADEDDD